jgi:two-component system response regulator NreC
MSSHVRLVGVPNNPDRAQPSGQGSIRIVLSDDHAAMRRSLRLALEGEADLEVVAEAADIPSVVRRVHGLLPHVLILDLAMPGGSSIETLRDLRRQVPETEVVVLTMNDDPVFARRALDAGAMGFVLKEMADVDLPQAVRSAAQGVHYVSPRVQARLTSMQRAPEASQLTARELEVLRLIALGHTSVEVASKLGLSPRTIETHRARIHRKLGMGTRAELVRYALEHGLLDV